MADWLPSDTAPFNISVLVYLPNWDHYEPGVYRAIRSFTHSIGTGA